MDMNMKGKTAIVTGGSKGIGLATARALAEEGVRVVVGSRSTTPGLHALVSDTEVTGVEVDLVDADGPERLVRTAVEVYGGVDLLVNNLGVSEPGSSSTEFTDEQWRRIFEATLFTAVRTVRSALPVMRGREGASIVNISSQNARFPQGMIAPYTAAKAALTNVSKAMAEELTPQGIRVNTVSPGPVRTPLWTDPGGFGHLMAEQAGTTMENFMDQVLPGMLGVTSGRISEPDEVAALVVFLASPQAGNITGSDYAIDGGMVKTA